MSNAPWLSILVPFYNVEAYLRDCIESVLGQVPEDGQDVEVVLLDDASPDGSTAIATDLARRHPGRIRIVTHAVNQGLSTTRNHLLDNARGRYVWFVDSDDIVLSGSLPALKRLVDTTAPDLVICDFRLLRNRFGLRHRLRGELHRPAFSGPRRGVSGDDRNALVTGLLEGRQLHVWSKIARREIWQQVRFPEARLFEDMAIVGQLVKGVQTWTHVAQPWIGYRQRGDSIMATMDTRKTLDVLASLCDLHASLANLPGGIDRTARLATDYFALRTFASLARKIPRGELSLEQRTLGAMHEIFPDGVEAILQTCRARGWGLRAWRARRSLAARGWL